MSGDAHTVIYPSLAQLTTRSVQGVQRNADRIDVDGLPHVGAVIYPKQAYYSKADKMTGGFAKELLYNCMFDDHKSSANDAG